MLRAIVTCKGQVAFCLVTKNNKKKKKEETAEVGGVRKKTLLKFGTRTVNLGNVTFRHRISV